MNNEEMLEKIRLERPNQVINEVISLKKNKHGFYNVKVDMETMFFNTKIKHSKVILPFPYSDYEKLSEKQQLEWRLIN